jgi:hypothetical protein
LAIHLLHEILRELGYKVVWFPANNSVPEFDEEEWLGQFNRPSPET